MLLGALLVAPNRPESEDFDAVSDADQDCDSGELPWNNLLDPSRVIWSLDFLFSVVDSLADGNAGVGAA